MLARGWNLRSNALACSRQRGGTGAYVVHRPSVGGHAATPRAHRTRRVQRHASGSTGPAALQGCCRAGGHCGSAASARARPTPSPCHACAPPQWAAAWLPRRLQEAASRHGPRRRPPRREAGRHRSRRVANPKLHVTTSAVGPQVAPLLRMPTWRESPGQLMDWGRHTHRVGLSLLRTRVWCMAN